MRDALAIRVEGLGKRYQLGERLRYHSLRESMGNVARAGVARLTNGRSTAASREFWALRDVDFEVDQGSVVGVVGRNGAGKTTLLRILSRITPPTTGGAALRGRTSSLLEVGTGFHPELTGRDNVMLSGAILGMRRRYLRRIFDEVVAFAEVEAFIDTPVKRYSSGMQLRLAFAVAAHLTADVLLVDEVLAVGDTAFQRKCLGKMEDVAHAGRTILFVSHQMAALVRLCSRAIWLDGGCVRMIGAADDVVAAYLGDLTVTGGERRWPDDSSAPGDAYARLLSVRVSSGGEVRRPGSTGGGAIDSRESVRIALEYRVHRDLPNSLAIVELCTADGTAVLSSHDSYDGTIEGGPRTAGHYVSVCEIPANLLNEGQYRVLVTLERPNILHHFRMDDVIGFAVERVSPPDSAFPDRGPGVIRPPLRWTLNRIG